MRPLVLLSDFGGADWYVAEMKGVLLQIGRASCRERVFRTV